MSRRVELTKERLIELFVHCEKTGEFIRKNNAPGPRCRAGQSAGWLNSNGYIELSIDGRRYYAHRLAWLYHYGDWPDGDVDHINCDGADNRIENLQVLTREENLRNTWFSRKQEKPYRPKHRVA